MVMKKLSSLIFAGVLFFSGTAIAQNSPERPTGGPGSGPNRVPGRPPVPKLVRDNTDFQQWSAEFRTARDTFRTQLQEMREALQNAEESQKEGIRAQIREHLKLHRDQQNAFRKRVRALTTEMRENKAAVKSDSEG